MVTSVSLSPDGTRSALALLQCIWALQSAGLGLFPETTLTNLCCQSKFADFVATQTSNATAQGVSGGDVGVPLYWSEST